LKVGFIYTPHHPFQLRLLVNVLIFFRHETIIEGKKIAGYKIKAWIWKDQFPPDSAWSSSAVACS
jgi:hypothetical protein